MLFLSPAAVADLGEVYRYGADNWGAARANLYLSRIKDQIWNLKTHPEIGSERPDLGPLLKSIPVGRHVIFYRYNRASLEVVRILHSRQDPSQQF